MNPLCLDLLRISKLKKLGSLFKGFTVWFCNVNFMSMLACYQSQRGGESRLLYFLSSCMYVYCDVSML